MFLMCNLACVLKVCNLMCIKALKPVIWLVCNLASVINMYYLGFVIYCDVI